MLEISGYNEAKGARVVKTEISVYVRLVRVSVYVRLVRVSVYVLFSLFVGHG